MSPLAFAPLQQRKAKCTKVEGTALLQSTLDSPLLQRGREKRANGIESLSVTLKITPSSLRTMESARCGVWGWWWVQKS